MGEARRRKQIGLHPARANPSADRRGWYYPPRLLVPQEMVSPYVEGHEPVYATRVKLGPDRGVKVKAGVRIQTSNRVYEIARDGSLRRVG